MIKIRNFDARMAKIDTMPAAQLMALKAAVDAECSRICTAMIDAGYGYERVSETRSRAAATGDALATASTKLTDARQTLYVEIDYRMKMSGTLKPWKST